MIRQKKNHGYSLFDLIAVCCTWMIVGSVVLPTVRSMRANSRNEECKDRIRQLVLAAHNYHDANRHLPIGTMGVKGALDLDVWRNEQVGVQFWKNQQNTSSLVSLLLFLDLRELADSFDTVMFDERSNLADSLDEDGQRIYQWFGEIKGVDKNYRKPVQDFHCPSDTVDTADVDDEGEFQTVVATQPIHALKVAQDGYDVGSDLAYAYWPTDQMTPEELARTNYIGCVGAIGGASWGDDSTWRGVMLSRQTMRLEEIADGTSRTILYGESIGEVRDSRRISAQSWLFGGLARGRGNFPLGRDSEHYEGEVRYLGDATNSSVVGFSSNHVDGVNFGLCDGATVTLSRDINGRSLDRLCGGRDGHLAEFD